MAFAALVVIGAFGLGRSAAAAGPSLPLLPTLAPPSLLPGVTLPPLPSLPVSTLLPLPSASLPIATILPVPSASLPIATILPLPSASLPLATRSPLPSASLPTVTSAPLPSPSLPIATATPRSLTPMPRPSPAPSPFATAEVAPASTPVPPSPVPARVIPVTSSVGTRPASTGLIVSEVSPERPVTVAVAATTRVAAAQLAWLVPGLVLGLPGVLLMAIVTAQILGAAAFLGLTRRTLGGLGIDTVSRRAD
jgi:hypothetical protein